MDHAEAVQMKATERYLLNELDPEMRDQFEEHLFECQECALDVRAGAMFVEQTKAVLAEPPIAIAAERERQAQAKPGWFAWFRPAFAIPVLAILLVVLAYQNFVTYPHLMKAANEPRVGPWGSVNVATRGAAVTTINAHAGEGFGLLVSIPPDNSYSFYNLRLYSPAGKLQWSLKIPASSPDETRSIYVPGNGLQNGTYKLAVSGLSATGQGSDLGSYPIELQIQQ